MESNGLLSELPPELWQYLMSYVEANNSLPNIMMTARCYNQLITDECKRRCELRQAAHLFQKSRRQSWWTFYYLFEVMPGTTEIEEYCQQRGMLSVGTRHHVNMEGVHFHAPVYAPSRVIYRARIEKPNQLPQRWIELGFSWDQTVDEYKALMWQYNKNYQKNTLTPSNDRFIGVLTSIAKCSNDGVVYFAIELEFNGYLKHIEVDAAATRQRRYKELYKDKVIEEK